MNFVYIIIILALIISLIALIITTITYRTYYSGMGVTMIFSYALIFIYTILEFLIYRANSRDEALRLSKFSTVVLVSGLYFLHYFHDEISVDYRQRKTMTFASLVWGMNIGLVLLDGAIKIKSDPFVPVLHPYFGLLITWQAALLIHRITSHIINMGMLSDHFGIEGKVKPRFREGVQKILYVFLFFSAISYILIEDQPSTNLTLIISFGGLLLSILYNKDPLSSLPFTQKIEAIALIREDNVEFLQVFESSGNSIAKQEDFGILVTTLIQFFKEMIKSETRIRSISTNDVLVMFEPCGTDYLILVLKYRAPLIRRILKLVATEVVRNKPDNEYQFSMIVNKYLLFRPITKIDA
ncbi:MAG: hypothetical protein ACXAC2_17225 [Candidatus Kariarchaeaceae archaeon]